MVRESKRLAGWTTRPMRRRAVRSAAAFLVFTLLYTPCVAAVAAIRRELDSVWKTFGVVVFQCLLAWGLGAAVYQIALLI